MSIKEHPPQIHVPVLLQATLDHMQPQPGESYLDLTAGYGGHAKQFLAKTSNFLDATLVDRDDFAIEHLQLFANKGARLIHADFVTASKQLIDEDRQFDNVLVDLGVSSPQLDEPKRGFSFTNSGPLDMRMDRQQTQTVQELVNHSNYDSLVSIITTYGEEPISFARRIATAIIDNRPLSTTKELADLVQRAHRGKWQRIHPATRTFQALRIAVNDELGQIEALLPLLPRLLKPGGRLGVISFHSLEDRLTKRFFKDHAQAGYEAELDVLTKKPIDGVNYDAHNPRSRSAKLRIAVKK